VLPSPLRVSREATKIRSREGQEVHECVPRTLRDLRSGLCEARTPSAWSGYPLWPPYTSRRPWRTARALLVVAVPLSALAALGGAYEGSTIPLLWASTIAFFASGAQVAATRETRALDRWLIVVLAGIVAQAVVLPVALVAGVSPHAWRIQSMLSLDSIAAARSLSIDVRLTRQGLASAAAAIMLFWAARAALDRYRVRIVARTIAWTGFVAALAGLAQRATAPTLLLWTWKPIDPGAQPFGPFVNRNHFATWLLLAASLTTGYLVAHLESRRLTRPTSFLLLLRELLLDVRSLVLVAAGAVMVLALLSSHSRAALMGAIITALTGIALSRHSGGSSAALRAGLAGIVLVFVWAAWLNLDPLLARFVSATEIGRLTVWNETWPIIRDFPIAGTGVGTFAQAMLAYQRVEPDTLFNQAHSEYLQLFAEGGLLIAVPVAGAFGCWFAIARRRLRTGVHELRWIRIGAVSGLCGVAVQCLWESGLRMPANSFLLALLAAVVVRASGSEAPAS
jgi:putative inorganic carbon (HCO3(-)) transporter